MKIPGLARALFLFRTNFGRDAGWLLELDGEIVGQLTEPFSVEMFWTAYTLSPIEGVDPTIALDDELWHQCRFDYRNRVSGELAPNAFAGGHPTPVRRGRVLMRGLYLAPESWAESAWLRLLSFWWHAHTGIAEIVGWLRQLRVGRPSSKRGPLRELRRQVLLSRAFDYARTLPRSLEEPEEQEGQYSGARSLQQATLAALRDVAHRECSWKDLEGFLYAIARDPDGDVLAREAALDPEGFCRLVHAASGSVEVEAKQLLAEQEGEISAWERYEEVRLRKLEQGPDEEARRWAGVILEGMLDARKEREPEGGFGARRPQPKEPL